VTRPPAGDEADDISTEQAATQPCTLARTRAGAARGGRRTVAATARAARSRGPRGDPGAIARSQSHGSTRSPAATMRSLLAVALVAALSAAGEAQSTYGVMTGQRQATVGQDQVGDILKANEDETMMNGVRNDDTEMIERVLARASQEQNEADIHQTAGDKKTLLMYAAIWGRGKEKVVPMLIDLGVPLNAVDDVGHTAVMYAASLNRPGVLRLLLVR
jgi:hypothetical protein